MKDYLKTIIDNVNLAKRIDEETILLLTKTVEKLFEDSGFSYTWNIHPDLTVSKDVQLLPNGKSAIAETLIRSKTMYLFDGDLKCEIHQSDDKDFPITATFSFYTDAFTDHIPEYRKEFTNRLNARMEELISLFNCDVWDECYRIAYKEFTNRLNARMEELISLFNCDAWDECYRIASKELGVYDSHSQSVVLTYPLESTVFEFESKISDYNTTDLSSYSDFHPVWLQNSPMYFTNHGFEICVQCSDSVRQVTCSILDTCDVSKLTLIYDAVKENSLHLEYTRFTQFVDGITTNPNWSTDDDSTHYQINYPGQISGKNVTMCEGYLKKLYPEIKMICSRFQACKYEALDDRQYTVEFEFSISDETQTAENNSSIPVKVKRITQPIDHYKNRIYYL